MLNKNLNLCLKNEGWIWSGWALTRPVLNRKESIWNQQIGVWKQFNFGFDLTKLNLNIWIIQTWYVYKNESHF